MRKITIYDEEMPINSKGNNNTYCGKDQSVVRKWQLIVKKMTINSKEMSITREENYNK